jgi:hypothetical protein
MKHRIRSLGIIAGFAGWAACVWAQEPSSRPERAPRPRPSAGATLPSGWPTPSAWKLPSSVPSAWPLPSGRPGRGLADLAEAMRRGSLRRDELRTKLGELGATRKARREARVAELSTRFGDAALADPALREELRVHARRMAFLHRAEMVAAMDLAEPKRAQTLALTAKEERRHGARVDAIRRAAPSGSALASATAIASSTGSAAAIAVPKASAP